MTKIYRLLISMLLLGTVEITSHAQIVTTGSGHLGVLTSADVENDVKGRLLQMQMESLGQNKNILDIEKEIKALAENQMQQNKCKQRKTSDQGGDVIEKLDSVITYQGQRKRYTYDLSRMLITKICTDNWDAETNTFVPYEEDTYEYNEKNGMVKYFCLYYVSVPEKMFGEGSYVEYSSAKNYSNKGYKWDNVKKEWYVCSQCTREYDENGWCIFDEQWNCDENNLLYPSYRYEYEYFDDVKDSYGNGIIKTKIDSYGKSGDTDFTISGKYVCEDPTYGISKGYTMVGSEWIMTTNRYYSGPHLNYCVDEYTIVGGQAKLSSTRRQHSFSSWDTTKSQSDSRGYLENCQYDTSSGKIAYGYKEEHKHGWGDSVEDDYYNWDTSKEQWVAYKKTIYANGQQYDYYLSGDELVCKTTIPEGTSYTIVEFPINMCSTTMKYINGKWVDISYWGSERIYDGNNPSKNKGLKYSLSYSRDETTGDYNSYSESFYTYDENNRLIEINIYNRPNTPYERGEYSYNDDGSESEYRYYSLEGSKKTLLYKDVYEYDPNILYSQTLGPSGSTNYNYSESHVYPTSFSTVSGHKLISVKHYDGSGNLLYVSEEDFYSPINESTEVKNVANDILSKISATTKTYNLQGVLVKTPHVGQIVVTDQGTKAVINK